MTRTGLLFATMFALRSTTTLAQERLDASREQLLRSAQEARTRGDRERALTLIRQVQSVHANPSVSAFIAEVSRELGRATEAYIAAVECRTGAVHGDGDPDGRHRAELSILARRCQALEAELLRREARVEVRMPENLPPEFEVTLNDVNLPRGLWNSLVPVTPGRVVVSARIGTVQRTSRPTTVRAGAVVRFALSGDGFFESRARLVYTRDAELSRCPNESYLRARLLSQFGEDRLDDGADRVIAVHLGRSGAEVVGRVVTRTSEPDQEPRRSDFHVERDGCHRLLDSVATSVGAQLELPAVSARVVLGAFGLDRSQPPPPPATVAAPTQESQVARGAPPRDPAVTVSSGGVDLNGTQHPEAPDTSSRARRPPPESWRLRVGASVLASGGVEADLGLRGGLEVGIYRPPWSVRVELQAGAAVTPVSVGRAEAFVQSTMGVASGCRHVSIVAACPFVAVGALIGRGAGVAQVRQDVSPFVAVGARVAAEVPVARSWWLRAFGEIAVPLTPTTFQMNSLEIWRTAPVAWGGGLGVLTAF